MKVQHLQKAGKPVGLLGRSCLPKEHAEQLVGLLHCDRIRRSSKVQPMMLSSCTSHLRLKPMLNEPVCQIYRTIPWRMVSTWPVSNNSAQLTSKRFLNHLTVSSRLILWEAPTWVWHRRRLATRSPGRVLYLVNTSHIILLVLLLLTCSSRNPFRKYQSQDRT
jgi:hypothetical protein